MSLSRLKVDDDSGDGRRNAEFSSSHSYDGTAIHRETLTRVGQLASGKIEHQAVGMLDGTYLGLHQFCEGHLNRNTVSVLGDRNVCDYRIRVARVWIGGFLRNSGRCNQAGQEK